MKKLPAANERKHRKTRCCGWQAALMTPGKFFAPG
jgi:hypothetical protein